VNGRILLRSQANGGSLRIVGDVLRFGAHGLFNFLLTAL
jgi:hypothetical protein